MSLMRVRLYQYFKFQIAQVSSKKYLMRAPRAPQLFGLTKKKKFILFISQITSSKYITKLGQSVREGRGEERGKRKKGRERREKI